MADVETVLTQLEESATAFNQAQTKLGEAIKQTQTLRNGLFDSGDDAAGWSLTDAIGQLHAAQQHSMGLIGTLQACSSTIRREVTGQTPPRPKPTPSRDTLRIRSLIGLGLAVFAGTDLVLDLLGKPWISDRVFWAVLGVGVVIYISSLALGTERDRRFALFALAGIGAGLTGRALAARATGWGSDDWRTPATATAVLLVAAIIVIMLQRRRRQ
jgi:hypothetical protein